MCALIIAFSGSTEGQPDTEINDWERPCPDGNLVRETKSAENRLPDASWVRRRCSSAKSPVIRYTVGIDGSVLASKIVRGTGCDSVDAELLRCVSMWQFEPATCDGVPISIAAATVANWGYGTPKEGDDSHRTCTTSVRQDIVSGLWHRLLQSSLGKSHIDHLFVERVAEVMSSTIEGALATLLLEEWDLPPVTKELQRPRVVKAPSPDFSDLVGNSCLMSTVIVVIGQVSALGLVEDMEMKIESGVEKIDRRCIDAFSHWRYRPARGKSGYVASKAAATCHINQR